MEIVYENLQITDFERIHSSGFSLLKPEKTASSEGIAESRQKPTAESEIGPELEKNFQKNLSKFGRFRPFAPYINA